MELLLLAWIYDPRVTCNISMSSYVFMYVWLVPLIFNIAIVFTLFTKLDDECVIIKHEDATQEVMQTVTDYCQMVKRLGATQASFFCM